jgi:hypothetical protein
MLGEGSIASLHRGADFFDSALRRVALLAIWRSPRGAVRPQEVFRERPSNPAFQPAVKVRVRIHLMSCMGLKASQADLRPLPCRFLFLALSIMPTDKIDSSEAQGGNGKRQYGKYVGGVKNRGGDKNKQRRRRRRKKLMSRS